MSSLGKHWKKTPEQIKNLSNALKGRRAWNKGKKRPKFSKEWRENMGKAHKGLKRSLATRVKMSLSAKCRICHNKTNFNRKDWIKFFNNKII